LILIALLVNIFLHAIRINRMTHVGFIFLFILGCLTESLLTRTNGLIFFSTFAGFLYVIIPYVLTRSRG
jgi:hypothetical protein